MMVAVVRVAGYDIASIFVALALVRAAGVAGPSTEMSSAFDNLADLGSLAPEAILEVPVLAALYRAASLAPILLP